MVSTDFTFPNETGNCILKCALPPTLPPTGSHLQCLFYMSHIAAKYVSDLRLMLLDGVHPKKRKAAKCTHTQTYTQHNALY
jgi:hypothetical protein